LTDQPTRWLSICRDRSKRLSGIGKQLKHTVSWPLLKASVGWLVGILILVASIAHVSPASDALGYFDPPKWLVWSVVALALGGASFSVRCAIPMRIHLALLACVVWMVVRTLVREHPLVEMDILATWMLPCVLFALALFLDQKKQFVVIAGFLAVSGGVQALLMLLQYFGIDPLFSDTTTAIDYRPARMIGTIGYQNQAAAFVVICSVAVFVLLRRFARRLMLFCLVLVVVGLTGSRGAMAGAVVAILVSHVFLGLTDQSGKWRRGAKLLPPFGIVITAVAVVIAFAPPTRERFVQLFANWREVPALASRATMGRVALDIWLEKPLVGWGAGEFAFQYLDRLRDLLPREVSHFVIQSIVFAREPHNDYLQFAAEFGLVGISLFSIVFVMVVHHVWQYRSSHRAATTCLVYVLSYMMIASLVSFPWQTSAAGPLAALLVGVFLPRADVHTWPTGRVAGARFLRYGISSVYIAASIVLLAWSFVTARMNTDLPRKLDGAGYLTVGESVPGWMHKQHALIGAALAKHGAYPDALKELRHAYSGYRDVTLYNNLGHVLSKLGKWNEAVEIYARWTELGLDSFNALGNLATAYEQAGDYESAALTLNRRMTLWPEYDVDSAQRVATLYLRAGKAETALQVLQKFQARHKIAGDDLPAEYDNLTGAILVAMGKWAEAKMHFQSALAKKPGLVSAQRNLEQLAGAAQIETE